MSLEGTHLGNYQLLRPMGSGGMGEVYLAEDMRIHRQVAIKVIREEVVPYPDANTINEAARLFQREMKAISQLDHPHILPLFDFGEATVNRIKLTYMVMPFRQEGSLADWLQKRSSAQMLSTQEVAHFVSQAADALQHAHDHQLIHQDVKPSNFLIRSRSGHPSHPDLLLADFGIAKFTTATATVSQSIRGTPAYMAPEQWDGQPVAATDQYALAVMAYQLLTGRPPFLGGPGQVMRQHFLAQPQPPSTLNPQIPSSLDTVILRALAKQPEARFASIAEFTRVFQQAVQDAPPAAVSSAPPAATPSSLIKESLRPSTRGSDIRATLAISQAEALTGTSRMLTLPGGRRVTVSVPGGARDGQVVRLERQGESSPDGGEAGALVLTILVVAAQEAPSISPVNTSEAEETLLTAEPTVLATSAPTSRDRSQQLGTTLYTYRGHSGTVNTVAWSPDGTRIASGGDDKRVQVWSATTGRNIFTYRGHSARVNTLTWSPDGRNIASGSDDQTVQMWETFTNRRVFSYRVHSGWWVWVRTVAWSPDGKRIVSGSMDGIVQICDAASGDKVFTYDNHSSAVVTVAWSPDSAYVASGSDDKTVQVWQAKTGSRIFTYSNHSSTVFTVGWSPNGKRIASGSYDKTVQVWEATSGAKVFTYHGHSGCTNTTMWSPDGNHIASGSSDGSVQVWDATTGQHIFTYRGHSAPVNAVAWSPDGTRIASGGDDKTVQVWLAKI